MVSHPTQPRMCFDLTVSGVVTNMLALSCSNDCPENAEVAKANPFGPPLSFAAGTVAEAVASLLPLQSRSERTRLGRILRWQTETQATCAGKLVGTHASCNLCERVCSIVYATLTPARGTPSTDPPAILCRTGSPFYRLPRVSWPSRFCPGGNAVHICPLSRFRRQHRTTCHHPSSARSSCRLAECLRQEPRLRATQSGAAHGR